MKRRLRRLTEKQMPRAGKWGPALMAAGLAWLLFLFGGETPLPRASGLALVILGVTAAMRRMGFIASLAGGLTLAFCPAFWSQTGASSSQSAIIIIAIGLALGAVLATAIGLKRNDLAVGLGIAVFLAIFWSQIGTSQSLRINGFVTAWLMYLLVDMLFLTNPRPGAKPQAPRPYHVLGILFLFIVGAVNDPLAALFAPAVLLGLFLSYARLPAWYWLAMAAAIGGSLALLVSVYLLPQPPLVHLWGWREAVRWIELGRLLMNQFDVFGIMLAVIGLARLSRWHPALGAVTMLAYGAYAFFGLIYLGSFREILLMPLMIIQVIWMTYAVNTFGQWLNKTLKSETALWTHIASAVYLLVPAILLRGIL